jgi:hypothetical protein
MFEECRDAIGIHVGSLPSAAEYRLPDPHAVADLLDWLLTRVVADETMVSGAPRANER